MSNIGGTRGPAPLDGGENLPPTWGPGVPSAQQMVAAQGPLVPAPSISEEDIGGGHVMQNLREKDPEQTLKDLSVLVTADPSVPEGAAGPIGALLIKKAF